DAAVEVLAVADALQLKDEVVELLHRLQVAGAVLDVEPTLLGDGELRLLALGVTLEDVPALQILSVEEFLAVLVRPELDVTEPVGRAGGDRDPQPGPGLGHAKFRPAELTTPDAVPSLFILVDPQGRLLLTVPVITDAHQARARGAGHRRLRLLLAAEDQHA